MERLTVSVSLDTTAHPPVTMCPPHLDVYQPETEIIWSEDSSSPEKGFHFKALSFGPLAPTCFKNKHVTDPKITIEDENVCKGQFNYMIEVTYGKKTYSSNSGGIGADMGSPTIHNK